MPPVDPTDPRPTAPDQGAGREAPFYAFVRIVRQRLWVVLLCTLLVPAIAYGITSRQDKEYTATAKLLLENTNVDQDLAEGGGTAPVQPGGTGLEETSLDLVSVRAIAERTAKALGGSYTASGVAGAVDVVPNGTSNVVSIEASGGNKQQVALIANTYARQYILFRKDESRRQIKRVSLIVNRQLADAREGEAAGNVPSQRVTALSDRADQLKLLDKLQTGNAQLVERAEAPSAPTSPKPRRAALLGLGFGLLIGLGLATLFDVLSRRLNDPAEIEAIFERPLLGAIPNARSFAHGDGVGVFELSHGERASFDMVRANIFHYNDYNVSSMLVVSAVPSEGKSTVSWNLAVACAEAGNSVLLLEADLRLPTLARRLDLPSSEGLVDVLMGSLEPEGVIQRVLGSPDQEGSTLDVLAAGAPQSNPTYLIESERMEHLLLDLEDAYDLVIIDTPPTSAVPDAISLVERVSGVLVVSRIRHNTRKGAADLRETLENVRAPILGVVVNGVSAADMSGPYRYEYTTARSV
jgi:capsular exopolysaccharide synthesis family protein